jgi:hypothetical protein
MRVQSDCRKLFWKAFRTLQAQFARVVIPAIALLVVVIILSMMFSTAHAPVTHTTPATQFIAGEGPGNGAPLPTPTP